MRPNSLRLDYLDGLRGVAAIVVVVYHFACAFVPGIVPDQYAKPSLIADTPLNLFYNGPFAVMIFFCLSGFVVAQSAARMVDNLVVTLIARYLRLALPATASVGLAWILLSLLPSETLHLSRLLPHPWLAAVYQGSEVPAFLAALTHGLYGEFTTGESMFNNVLWTMRVELIGSIAIYCCYAFSAGHFRMLVLAVVALALILTHNVVYLGFAIGVSFRELAAAKRLPRSVPFAALAIGCLLGSVGTGFYERTGLPHVPWTLMPGNRDGLIYPIAAGMIVYASLTSPLLQRVLSSAGPTALGRISFSLYLFHVPLLYTIFASLYLYAIPVSILKICIIFMVFISTCLAVAVAGTAFIDDPTLALIRAFRRALRRTRPYDVQFAGDVPTR